jgi:hypothetical protein
MQEVEDDVWVCDLKGTDCLDECTNRNRRKMNQDEEHKSDVMLTKRVLN